MSAGTGPGEYYYLPDPEYRLSEEPSGLYINGTSATKGTIGSLEPGQWAWGDGNAFGFDTVYVRTEYDAHPVSLGDDAITYPAVLEIMQVSENVVCFLLSILISNFSQTEDANIWIFHTDSEDNVRFKWMVDLLATNSPFALDSTVVMDAQDKLKVLTNIEDVSIYISGDES